MMQIKFTPNIDSLYKLTTTSGESDLVWDFLKIVIHSERAAEVAIKKLISPSGEYNLNDYWAERKGDAVHLFHADLECYPETFIPYEKFIDLIEQWKLVLERQRNGWVYDHDYNELTIFADDDYNFTVMVDGKMVQK